MTEYNALSFDGIDDYAESTVVDNDNFTVIVIAKIHSTQDNTYPYLISTNETGPISDPEGDGFRILYNSLVGAVSFQVSDGTSYLRIDANAEKDSYALYAMSYDGSTFNTYVNLDKYSTTGSLTGIGQGLPLTIATSANKGIYNYINADILLVLYYNRALSDSEIQSIYNDPLNPPTDGLVLFYAPDSVDTANGVWQDKSGNGNDGTIYGATYVPLRPVSESTPSASRPYGLYFDGEDDYVKVDNFDLSSNSSFTLVWFGMIHDTGNDEELFQLYNPNSAWAEPVRVAYLIGGRLQVQLSSEPDTSSREFHTWSIGKYDLNIMIAVRFEGGQEISAWIDGVNIGTDSVSTSEIWATQGSLYLGQRNGHNWLKGKEYLALIYSRALSDSEIQQIYENPLDPPKDGLILWLSPESLDTANGKWLNRAEILNTGLVEQLDGTQYGTLLIPTRWTTRDGVITIEEIWELNTTRFTYPFPVSITDRVNRTVKIVPTLGSSPVVFDTGLGSEEVTFNFYILPSELATFRSLAQVGGIIKIRTPDLDYYGDYVIKDVDWSIDRMSAYQARIRAVKV